MKKVRPIIFFILYFVLFIAVSYNASRKDESLKVINEDEDIWHLNENDYPLKRNRRISVRKLTDFFKILKQPTGQCRKLVDVGGGSCRKKMDGNKQVCLDEGFFNSKNDCLVYSFGTGKDTSFEEEFIFFKRDCEIHIFDSAITKKDLEKNLNTSLKHHFSKIYPFGVFEKNVKFSHDAFPNAKEVLLRTMLNYKDILKILKRERRRVDYLKMVVKESGWGVIRNMLDENVFEDVKQLAMKIRLNDVLRNSTADKWNFIAEEKLKILNRLETEAGFRKIHYNNNDDSECQLFIPKQKSNVTVCGEILYIK